MFRYYGALAIAIVTAWGQEPAFRSGTRYVEVDVTVRHNRVRPPGVREFFSWTLDGGPPFGPPGRPYEGLTKEDFRLLDNGKPQPIAEFNRQRRDERSTLPVPTGAFSNRTDSQGMQLEGSTVILVDLMNTPFPLTDYARLGLKEMLQSMGEVDSRVAVYSLGSSLHVLLGLTDGRQKLRDAILQSQEGDLPEDFALALRDTGGILGVPRRASGADIQQRAEVSIRALQSILEQLSGLPGRKNLIWLAQEPPLYAAVLSLIERANVTLYPVKVRGADSKLATRQSMSSFARLAVYGGRAFFDARDLRYAVQTAAEDLSSHYVLGFYPPEGSLDGKVHTITVRLDKRRDDVSEINYRQAYVASRDGPPAVNPQQVPTLLQLFESPLQATGLGMVAEATSDPRSAGAYRLLVTVDLHDVRLEFMDGRFRGSLEFASRDPASATNLKIGTIHIDLPEDRYLSAMTAGHTFAVTGVEPVGGEIHFIVRDVATKAWGSLRFPIP